jgi:hypothetical protein
MSNNDSIWQNDKPEMRRLGYELLRQLAQKEFKDSWIVPKEPFIIDEIIDRDLNSSEFAKLLLVHEKLCRLDDIYYQPCVGVSHKQTKEQVWIFSIAIRYTNNGRLYIYSYSFSQGSESAHGGNGLIKFDDESNKFHIEQSTECWQA